MSAKSLVMLGLFVGSTAGSYIPVLFGASVFSFVSVIGGAVGGAIGVYICYKISEY